MPPTLGANVNGQRRATILPGARVVLLSSLSCLSRSAAIVCLELIIKLNHVAIVVLSLSLFLSLFFSVPVSIVAFTLYT